MKLMLDKIPSEHACPRCGSHKIYSSNDDFFCLTCSLIIVENEEEYKAHRLHWR